MLEKIKSWLTNNLTLKIHCDAEHSTIILSKRMVESMQKDHPNSEKFDVVFSKFRYVGSGPEDSKLLYVMFFNPEWEKHGVKDPKKIQSIPVTISKEGHVGFQSVQPTVKEIQAMYGKPEDVFDIDIRKSYINDEPYYILERP